jgi:hypothetical protein
VSILLVFAVEVVLLVIAFDLAFFTHPFYVIDAIIIGTATTTTKNKECFEECR